MPLQTQLTAQPAAPATARPASGLLTTLPRDTQLRLLAQTSRVLVPKGECLTEAGSASTWSYFICAGVVSVQTMTAAGETVEVAMIGREGIVNIPLASASVAAPHTSVVAIPGEALRIRADLLLKEVERDTVLQRAVIHYSFRLINEIAQGVVCNRFHTARQRLARWLLAASDRTQCPRIPMTQERLGQALGLQRTGVTAASVALQDAGAIKARHGQIAIVDRRRLEALACECYRIGTERSASGTGRTSP